MLVAFRRGRVLPEVLLTQVARVLCGVRLVFLVHRVPGMHVSSNAVMAKCTSSRPVRKVA